MARLLVILSSFIVIAISAGTSLAGEWRVVPIRLDLSRAAKSSVVRLINSGEQEINFQVQAMEWSQDDSGEDIYTETQDLIFFPKVFSVPPREERILRAGIRVPALEREKTYRLFIEEIPKPADEEGSTVAINIRFALPVFVAPMKEEVSGEIGKIRLEGGEVTAAVKNTGNRHFRIHKLTLSGSTADNPKVFEKELRGWYLLAGATRDHSWPITPEECLQADRITVTADTDKIDLSTATELSDDLCR